MLEFFLKNYLSILLFLGLLFIFIFIRNKVKKANNTTEFGLMIDFLKERTKKPSSSIAYWLYFLLIVFLVGISGSLISAIPTYKNGFDMNSTSLSLIGYAVVLLCSSSIELIFIDLKDKENKYDNIKKGIIMLGVGLVILSILFGVVTYFINGELAKFSLSILACLLATYFWWITNATNSSVLETIAPPTTESTTGGEPNNLSGGTPPGFTE